MAKHTPDRDEKAKVKFVYIELEGGSAALQDTIRTVAATINRAPPARALTLSAPNAGGGRRALVDEAENAADDLGPLFEGERAETVAPSNTEESVTQASSPPSRARSKPPTPKVVDLDFISEPMPLEKFANEKQPGSVAAKYLVVASWLKEHRQIERFTMNEMYTAFRHMKWPVPDDPSQPLRDLCNKRDLFKKEGKGTYSINHLGQNEVDKMPEG